MDTPAPCRKRSFAHQKSAEFCYSLKKFIGEGKLFTRRKCSFLATVAKKSALQRQNTENSNQISPGKELCGYSPNSYIHVSVSDLYIPQIGLPVLLQENRRAERGNI